MSVGIPNADGVRLRSFLGESALYGLGSVADKLVGFLLLPLTTALLSPTDFGVLNVFGTTASLALILVSVGLHQATPILNAELPYASDRRRLFATAVVLTSFAAAILIVVAFAFGSWIGPAAFGTGSASLVYLLGPHAFLYAQRLLGYTRLRLEQRPQLFVAVNAVSTVVIRGAALGLVAAGLGVKGWVLGELIGAAITLAILWPSVFSDFGFRLDRGIVSRLLPMGLALTPSLLAHWVMMGSDRYVMLGVLTDPAHQIGLYSIGERISTIMQLVNVAFVLGWQRYAFENLQRPDGERRFAHGLTLYAVVGGYAALGLAMLGDDLTRFITPASYNAGVVVIPMLTLAGFIGGFAELTSARLQHANLGLRLGAATWMAAGVQVALLFWAIDRYGILGAAGACLAGQSLKMLLIVAVGWRHVQVQFEYRRLLLLAFVFGSAYALGGAVGDEGSGRRFLWQLGVVAATPLLVVGTGFLAPDEKQRVAGGLRRLFGMRTATKESVSERE
jgi:O-antigen/teichoic acid export membrane protein